MQTSLSYVILTSLVIFCLMLIDWLIGNNKKKRVIITNEYIILLVSFSLFLLDPLINEIIFFFSSVLLAVNSINIARDYLFSMFPLLDGWIDACLRSFSSLTICSHRCCHCRYWPRLDWYWIYGRIVVVLVVGLLLSLSSRCFSVHSSHDLIPFLIVSLLYGK